MSRHTTKTEGELTEREGFEPSNEVNPRYAISSRARSTAPAPLQRARLCAPALRRDCARRELGYRRERGEGKHGSPAGRVTRMVIAASQAFSKTVGLVITFGGIGVFANAIIILIAVQIRGERRQNREYRERMLDR